MILQSVVLRLNGIPTPITEELAGEGFIRDPMGGWRPLLDDGLYASEAECVSFHDALALSIFGSMERYHALLPLAPDFLWTAGLNSESPVSRDMFEQLLIELLADFPELNRFLYLYDCRMLVSSIQECTKEVGHLTGEFYRALNLDPLFIPVLPREDGVRWSTSPVVTNLSATLSFIYIRLHSLLDYMAKLARECENLRTDFRTYPRLASSNFLFGQRSRLRINKRPGSLFEECDEVAEVELVRNLVIHDGLLDDMPKAYEVTRDGKAVEKYLLMPDRKDGQFEKFKNRRLFYGRENKVNLRLPHLIRGFQTRQVETLKLIRAGLDRPARS
jgi:hypothetical protein